LTSWQVTLKETLANLSKADPQLPPAPVRTAVVGMGHELRGDDAAGIMVARALQPMAHSHLLVVDAGSAPENCTGPIRRFAPGMVLLVDAAQLDEAPGAVRWLAWQETTGLSASTHTMPPYVLARYLTAELNTHVALIGIQPAATSLGATLSPEVRQAVNGVVQIFRNTLGQTAHSKR